MSDDVLITPASRKIEFKDSSGNIDGKIELDGSGNLQITSTGLIGIGDTSEDIHIGDGTQAVDLVFDYGSRIYSVAAQDLTIGKSSLGGNDIIIDSPNWTVSSAGVATLSDLTLADGKVEITQSDGSAHGLKVYRNDDSTSTPLVYFHDDHAYNDSAVLHVKTDRADQYGYAAFFEGKVGIGNTSPVSKLHVSGDTTIYDTTNEAHLVLRRDATGANYGAAIKWEFGDSVSASSGHEYARITGNIQDSTNNSEDGYMTFQTSKDGTLTEAVRIDKDGHLIMRQNAAHPTITVHSDTNSGPLPRIELMRGTHDTWGSGDGYTDWRIEDDNHLKFYSGRSDISSGSAVERFEILSDGSGITNNNAYVIPGTAGTSGQVLKWPSSGTVLEWADESGGGGSIDADANLASNPEWTVTSTSGVGLYLVRDKDDSNSDQDLFRIREHHADSDQASLYVLNDGGAQMNQQDFGRCFSVGAQATGNGTTFPLQLVNGTNTNSSANYAGVGLKFKLSGWGTTTEGRKFSSIAVVSQSAWSMKHKMVFKVYGSVSSNQDVSTAMVIKNDLEIDGNFNDTSDVALKSNIKTIPNGLGMIEKLNPVTFNWNVEENNQPSAGFIAQEVEEVLPDLVRGEEGEKTIKTAGVVGYLVKAVQELSARVKELEGGN